MNLHWRLLTSMTFASALRRNYWVVPLLSLGLVAVASARGISAASRWAVSPTAAELAAPPLAPTNGEGSLRTARNVDPILARNPFDGEGGALSRPSRAEPVGAGPALEATDPADAPPCDGVRLLVSVSSSDAAWSLASFEAGGEGKNVLVRRGDSVAGKQVEYIGWDRAFLSSGSSLCQARLFQPSAPALVAAAPVVAPVGGVDPSIGKGIRKLSATEYEIDRAVLDRIVDSQGELLKSIRVVPEKQGDQVKGLKLLGIKTGSLLALLGMENGDRLQTINGFDVTSPEKALEAYARLRSGVDRLTLQIERAGKGMNLDYAVK